MPTVVTSAPSFIAASPSSRRVTCAPRSVYPASPGRWAARAVPQCPARASAGGTIRAMDGIRLHRPFPDRGGNARDRPRRPRVAVARRQARAVHHPRRHADDADAAVLRALPAKCSAARWRRSISWWRSARTGRWTTPSFPASSACRSSTAAPATRASSTTNGPTPRRSPRSARFPRPRSRSSPAAGSTQPVTVALNRRIFDYDQIIICGPVFPHEVVGFSGGNKYFFPGIAGADVINFTHWLGALITNYEIIGSGYTPVRAVIDRAASMVTVPTVVLRAGRDQGRPRRALLRLRARGVGARVRAVGQAPHRLARRAGAPGALGDAADVRRHLDGRQGHVQDRAGGRRRRRSDHLRAAHHAK